MVVRFYDSAPWRRLRRAKLGANPLCEACQVAGIVTPAKAVDHVVPINAGGPALPSLDGLRALCVPCHTRKTRAVDMGGSGRHVHGFDAEGNPLDAGDAWHGNHVSQGNKVGSVPHGNTATGEVVPHGNDLPTGGHAGALHNTPDTLPFIDGGASHHHESTPSRPAAVLRTDLFSDDLAEKNQNLVSDLARFGRTQDTETYLGREKGLVSDLFQKPEKPHFRDLERRGKKNHLSDLYPKGRK